MAFKCRAFFSVIRDSQIPEKLQIDLRIFCIMGAGEMKTQ